MPVSKYMVNYGEPTVPRYTASIFDYGPHSIYFSVSDKVIVWAKENLKNIARELDALNLDKKVCEREKNIDAARWYRELISQKLKEQRAWKLAIGFFVDEPNLPYKPTSSWPIDLSPELDAAVGALSIK